MNTFGIAESLHIFYSIMYRKYTPIKTNVLNPFNYLLDTQEISNNQKGIFHQVLISSESLPTLLDHKNVEMIIS